MRTAIPALVASRLERQNRGALYLFSILGVLAVACGRLPSASEDVAVAPRATTGNLDCEQYQVDDGTVEGHSSHLGCTGLYSDWAQQMIAPGVSAFKPGYVLWSDGAEKRRWIFLPPGTQIDSGGDSHSGSMNGWIFPVGTKAWKQFSFGNRRVETRFLWKRQTGWFRATYVWSEDESAALEYTGSVGILVEGADSTGPAYEQDQYRGGR